MSYERVDNPDPMLEAHLDGLLDASQHAAFQDRLAQDPAAQAAIQHQQRIDEALRRLASPGDAHAAWARVEAAQRAGRVTALLQLQRRRRAARLAMAAAVVLALGGTGGLVWWTQHVESTLHERQYADQPWRTFEMVYRDEVQAGFRADWECKSEKEFAGTFWKRFGQGLLLAQLPQGVQSLGLSYCNTLSKKTVTLLALVHGEKVIVFVDRPSKYQEEGVSPASGLHLYRQELGRLILFELSPLDHPHLLELFYDPQQPASWYAE